MTQEEKQLLLKDLCARLPYEVICKWENDGYSGGGKLIDVCKVKTSTGFVYWDCYFESENNDIPIEIVKPYLRPMSSMTEEEQDEFLDLIIPVDGGKAIVEEDKIEKYNEFIYSHHLDICGLIPKGLALEAEEGMYKTK